MASSEIVPNREQMIAQLNEKLGALVKRGEAIQVTDQTSDILAKQYRVEIKSYEKAVDLATDGEIQDLKERLTKKQTEKKMLLAPALAVLEIVDRRRKTWEEDERRRAEAEQRRLQEEARIATEKRAAEERRERERVAEEERKKAAEEADRLRKIREKELEEQRKAGELTKRELEKAKKLEAELAAKAKAEADKEAERQRILAAEEEKKQAADVPTVKVQANIEAVAGTQSRRNWKFEITNAAVLKRKYLMPDSGEIGKMVRDTKDKAKAEAECPGIRVWSE